jgi:hypothetical protein
MRKSGLNGKYLAGAGSLGDTSDQIAKGWWVSGIRPGWQRVLDRAWPRGLREVRR